MALEPVIDSLALRLILMAVLYLAVGGVVATIFAKKLKHDVKPDLTVTKHEARSTVQTMKEAVDHG